jgi:3-carboxy-cis,cis-muconate cycloisomerase
VQTESDQGLLAPIWAGSVAEARTGDGALIRAMLSAEAALARALASTGLAPARAAEVITRVAAELSIDPRALALAARSGGNPVIPLVRELRAAVAAADPDAVEWVHRGTTSQDVLDTAFMTVSAAVLSDAVLPGLAAATEAAARLAAEHRGTVLAGRTLTQHAVPTTFGVKVAGWLSGLLDADERCRQVRAKLPAQLGGAAGTLAALDGPRVAVAEAFAAECGLTARETPWHAVRTPVAELAGALALATGACGKAALDVTVLAQTELGEVAGDPGGESSAMPQKRNPVFATLVATAARQVPAQALVLFASMTSEDERSAGGWHAEWQPLRECLRNTAGAAWNAAELLAGLRVFPDRMAANLRLTGGAVLSERVSAMLAPTLGKTAAKRLLTDVSNSSTPLADALASFPLSDVDVTELLDPVRYLGLAGELVDQILARPRSAA